MEDCHRKGLARSLGVANFTPPLLLDLLTYCEVRPVLHNIEVTPFLPQRELIQFCEKLDLKVLALAPLCKIASRAR